MTCWAKKWNPSGYDLIQVADTAVGHGARASQGLVDIALHLAPEGADRRGVVEVLDDHDPGQRRLQDEVPPVEIDGRLVGRRRRSGGPHARRHGIAGHHPQLREDTADFGAHEPGAARADVEGLDGIGHGRRVVTLQGQQLAPGQWRGGPRRRRGYCGRSRSGLQEFPAVHVVLLLVGHRCLPEDSQVPREYITAGRRRRPSAGLSALP